MSGECKDHQSDVVLFSIDLQFHLYSDNNLVSAGFSGWGLCCFSLRIPDTSVVFPYMTSLHVAKKIEKLDAICQGTCIYDRI